MRFLLLYCVLRLHYDHLYYGSLEPQAFVLIEVRQNVAMALGDKTPLGVYGVRVGVQYKIYS